MGAPEYLLISPSPSIVHNYILYISWSRLLIQRKRVYLYLLTLRPRLMGGEAGLGFYNLVWKLLSAVSQVARLLLTIGLPRLLWKLTSSANDMGL